MIKIIKKGVAPVDKEVTRYAITCATCQSELECEQYDLVDVSSRHAIMYYLICPVCNVQLYVTTHHQVKERIAEGYKAKEDKEKHVRTDFHNLYFCLHRSGVNVYNPYGIAELLDKSNGTHYKIGTTPTVDILMLVSVLTEIGFNAENLTESDMGLFIRKCELARIEINKRSSE